MIIKEALRAVLPESVLAFIRSERAKRTRAHSRPRTVLNEDEFRGILMDALRVRRGDVVFVHSSIDRLGLAFPFYRILSMLREIIGDSGTVLFPTYPGLPAHEAALSGEVFDVRKSPSFTGVLTEFARRQPGAIRSLNPTKSVCALGPHAQQLTMDHHQSPYPYDRFSPYYRLMDVGGKVIGLGVSTRNLSFIHCVEDELKDDFPVRPYFPRLFDVVCRDYAGREVNVRTYAHDPDKMRRDIPRFVRQHIWRPPGDVVVQDLDVHGMPFFWANAAPLFDVMVRLARQGTTVYDRSVYEDAAR